MENQKYGEWPEVSGYGEKHQSHIGYVLLLSAVMLFLNFLLFFYPHWLLLLVNLCVWFATSMFVVVRMFNDHEMILRLRRMYHSYFDYCVALKRSTPAEKTK